MTDETKTKLAALKIFEYLDSISCVTCNNDGTDWCRGCKVKNNNWTIKYKTAMVIAEKIVNAIS